MKGFTMGKKRRKLMSPKYAGKARRLREVINSLLGRTKPPEESEEKEAKVVNALKQLPPETLVQVEEPAPTPAVEKTTKTTRKKSATTKKQPKTTKKRSTTPRKTRAKKETV